MTNPDDIRFITRYYESLRGLINLPIALIFIALATQYFYPAPLWTQGDCTITMPLFAVALVSLIPINSYYRKRFGAVQVSRPGRFTLYVILAVFSIFLVGWIDGKLLTKSPVSLYVLVIAVWMFAVGWERRRWYYRVFGALLFLVSFMPSLSNRIGEEQFIRLFGGIFNLAFGLGFAVMGLLDHRLLTRLLRPVQEAGNAQSE